MNKLAVVGVLLLCLSLQARADDVTDDAEEGLDNFDERNVEETLDDDLTVTDEDTNLDEREEVKEGLETRSPLVFPSGPVPCKKRTYYSRSYRGVYYTKRIKNTVCLQKNAKCYVPPVVGKCKTRVVTFLAQGRCRRRRCRGYWCHYYRRRGTIQFFARRRECICAKQCPPFVCLIFCPCGNVMVGGCPICKCKACPTCPPLCKNKCPCGRIHDNNGCPTCQCQRCGSHSGK